MTEKRDRTGIAIVLRVCVNLRAGDRLPSCAARGSLEMVAALESGLAERGLDMRVERVHCMTKCHIGPTIRVLPEGPFIVGVQRRDVPRVLDLLEQGEIDALAAAFPLPEDDPDA